MITVYTVNRYLEDNGKPRDKGYLLKDAGAGPKIVVWEVAGLAQPSVAQLSVIQTELNSAKASADLEAQAREDYLEARPSIENQLNALMTWAASADVTPELKQIAEECMAAKAIGAL